MATYFVVHEQEIAKVYSVEAVSAEHAERMVIEGDAGLPVEITYRTPNVAAYRE